MLADGADEVFGDDDSAIGQTGGNDEGEAFESAVERVEARIESSTLGVAYGLIGEVRRAGSVRGFG